MLQKHKIAEVVDFEILGPYFLKVIFDDGKEQAINFLPVLEGELYGPLQDLRLFNQVRIDPQAHTLVWPNGADFDPETLYNWPKYKEGLKRRARAWRKSHPSSHQRTQAQYEQVRWLVRGVLETLKCKFP